MILYAGLMNREGVEISTPGYRRALVSTDFMHIRSEPFGPGIAFVTFTCPIRFAAPLQDGPWVMGFGIWDQERGGAPMFQGPLGAPTKTTPGIMPCFAPGSLQIEITSDRRWIEDCPPEPDPPARSWWRRA